MKYLLYVAATFAALCAAVGCTHAPTTPQSALDRVESAYTDGRYAMAQALADSLVIGSDFTKLGTWDLCRLSLVLMRLGENADNSEGNTAFAARCLRAAMSRDSDSTALYIKVVNNEDRACLMLLNSLNEASHTAPADEDSIPYEE